MLISTDCGYNEADFPSISFHNVPLSFKIVLTVVGRSFGSLINFHMHAGEQQTYSLPHLLLQLAQLGTKEKSINMSNLFSWFLL